MAGGWVGLRDGLRGLHHEKMAGWFDIFSW